VKLEVKRRYVEQRRDLTERLFVFSVDVIMFLREIKYEVEINELKKQLTKSATSVGANYEESQAAYSKADFKFKVSLALKEIRETNYWLRIFDKIEIGDKEKRTSLVKESEELKKILGAICKKL